MIRNREVGGEAATEYERSIRSRVAGASSPRARSSGDAAMSTPVAPPLRGGRERLARLPARAPTRDSAVEPPVPLWACAMGVGLGVGLALLAGQSDHVTMVPLLAGAAAAGGLGAYGFLDRLARVRNARPRNAVALFERFFDTAPEPTALIDATGRLRAMNRAARAVASPDARRAADLTPSARLADGVVFRLLREALQDRAAREVVPPLYEGGPSTELLAWPCGRGLVAWRWRELARTPSDPLNQAASVAWFRADADGRVVDANAEFCAWLDVDDPSAPPSTDSFGRAEPRAASFVGLDVRAVFPEASRRLTADAAPMSLLRTRLRGASNGPSAVSLMVAPLAESAGFVGVAAPAAREERSNIAPLTGADAVVEALDSLSSARLFEDAPIGVIVLSTSGEILRLNGAADRFFARGAATTEGHAPSVVGRALIELLAEDDRGEAVRRLAAAESVGPFQPLDAAPAFEARLSGGARESGVEPPIAQFYVSRVDGPKRSLLLCYLIDASERRALEARFHQTSKLQAIGQLAGGVAHDFNNLLTIIITSAEILLQRHAAEDPNFADLNAIYQSAHRAANLVGQLLAYSRKQTLRPQVVNLTERMSEFSYLLNRLIGEKAKLRQELSEDVWLVKVDVNQFEQVVTNLVVNAKDAMPEGGRITLATRNVAFDAASPPPHKPMDLGEYVCVEVRDTGTGIPRDKLEKIFEPFFTTKGVGEGTGLGLATVYGIVKQTGGYIFVDSEVGVGATFTIYLPRAEEGDPTARLVFPNDTPIVDVEPRTPASQQDAEAPPTQPTRAARSEASVRRARSNLNDLLYGGEAPTPTRRDVPPQPNEPAPHAAADAPVAENTEIILLVDDEAPVRELTARALRAWGYTVYEAESGEEALELLEQAEFTVDLLLSDVVMPHMDGPTLLRRISAKRPDMRTLFMSGYARDAFSGAFEADLKGRTDFGFLQKPFKLNALAKAVRDQIDQ